MSGNGDVEEGGAGVMARIYHEMPRNSIWEGSEKIMAIDPLRALRKSDAAAAMAHECGPARGAHPALDRLLARLPARIDAMTSETDARTRTQDIALALQACLLVQSTPTCVHSAFCDARLAGNMGPCLRYAQRWR